MEGFSFEKGVFIHSKDLESQFMLQCLCSLLKSCPSIRIQSLECDERTNGYKVYFGESESRSVLEKKYLEVSGQQISVFPLSTYLLIHDVRGSGDLEQSLADAIQEKFGKVLNIDKLPEPEDQSKDKATDSYLVLVDIPENENSNTFAKNGYPRMSVTVPKLWKTFNVTFWCRRCKTSGHSNQECNKFTKQDEHPDQSPNLSAVTSESPIKMQPNMPPETGQFDTAHEAVAKVAASSILEPIDSFATKIGEEIVKNSGISSKTPTRRYKITDKGKTNLSLILEQSSVRSVKESEEDSMSGVSSNNTTKENDPAATPVKKEPRDDDDHEEGGVQNNNATSTTDDDVQILNFSEKTEDTQLADIPDEAATTTKFVDSIVIKKEEEFSDDSTLQSPPVTPKAAYIDPTPCGRQQPGPSISWSSPYQVTSCLSPQLQSCLDCAYEKSSVLERQKLDAFLIHVKKKSNPIRVAKNYTENVLGLKEQLNQILYFYYNTPQVGTKEDIQFIKWLNGLVERFEGTIPRKRKRKSSADDSSNKKK